MWDILLQRSVARRLVLAKNLKEFGIFDNFGTRKFATKATKKPIAQQPWPSFFAIAAPKKHESTINRCTSSENNTNDQLVDCWFRRRNYGREITKKQTIDPQFIFKFLLVLCNFTRDRYFATTVVSAMFDLVKLKKSRLTEDKKQMANGQKPLAIMVLDGF